MQVTGSSGRECFIVSITYLPNLKPPGFSKIPGFVANIRDAPTERLYGYFIK